ncbi:hypothetical protein V1478_005433 [Vespula squamosa]|uniref:Uncharacterized protein n=1 Tax=Vespula squamosa TaxID=30214 RepID=A0ABD2BEA3_VESSQ
MVLIDLLAREQRHDSVVGHATTVEKTGTKNEANRSEKFQFNVYILFVNQCMETGRYKDKAQTRNASETENDRNNYFHFRCTIVYQRPDTNWFDNPTT